MRIGSEVEMIASSAESMLSIFRVGACADAGFTNIAAAPVTAANFSICRREKLPAFMIVPPMKFGRYYTRCRTPHHQLCHGPPARAMTIFGLYPHLREFVTSA